MNIKQAIADLLEGKDFSREAMVSVMREIMTGEATPAQIGAFLMGLRIKGETVDEITGAASVMRELASKVDVAADNLVDTCGTGGDASGLFNVSTASALIAATAGCQVAKHGNRSVSSSTGSADVLEAAGVNLNLNAGQVAECVKRLGIGFMFAPAHHSAMKHAIGPRKEMGVRTIFNLLGPLTNPAGAKRQVLGVFSAQWVRPMAEVLRQLGSEHVMVVHSLDGLDELSVAAHSMVAELKDGEITEYRIGPEDFGLALRDNLNELKVETAEASLELIRHALTGHEGAAADILALNAGAAIYVAGKANDLAAGVSKARAVLAQGEAWKKLQDLAEFSRDMS